jgi:Tfp pilus assembly protein PilV
MKENKRKFKKVSKSGFLVIEVLVAVSIITACVLTAMAVAQKSIILSYRSVHTTQAGFLLEEGAEAVRILRDNNWSNIANLVPGTDYYLVFSGNTWTLSTSPNTVGKFTRKINFSTVYRDAVSGNISLSGTEDTRSRFVNITVSWNEGSKLLDKQLSFYIMDIFSS